MIQCLYLMLFLSASLYDLCQTVCILRACFADNLYFFANSHLLILMYHHNVISACCCSAAAVMYSLSNGVSYIYISAFASAFYLYYIYLNYVCVYEFTILLLAHHYLLIFTMTSLLSLITYCHYTPHFNDKSTSLLFISIAHGA